MSKSDKKKVIAILCADIHMSHRPPVWRSAEPDWYEAMKRPLREIEKLRRDYDCIILCAGDIFDKWNSPPELINFAIHNLPLNMFCLPGQHDLPEHNYANLYRSAYTTLFASKRTRNMNSIETQPLTRFTVYSFPYGLEVKPPDKRLTKELSLPNIAIIHNYVWIGKHKYPNAPKEAKVETHSSKMINGKLYGYDIIVYGDNHKGFLTKVGKTTVFNCGTLMRRKSDEIDYKPQVGLLYNDGSVEPHYLDISQDKYLTVDEMKSKEQINNMDLEDFAKELLKLSSSALDFTEAMKQFCRTNKVKKEVQKIINTAMIDPSNDHPLIKKMLSRENKK